MKGIGKAIAEKMEKKGSEEVSTDTFDPKIAAMEEFISATTPEDKAEALESFINLCGAK